MGQEKASARGLLSLEALRDLVAKGEIETVIVGFTDHYGRLLGKRFDAERFVEDIAAHGAHACDYLLTVDMEMDPVPGYKFANWELGYGDFHLVPDMATLRRASWLEKSALVLCDVKDEKSHELVSVAPRSILRRQVEAAGKLNFQAFAATELEHYLFRTSYRDASQKGYRDLEAAGWYLEDYHILQGTRTESFHAAARRHLKLSGVPVETSKGEWGEGQHELNVRYAEALDMGDRHVIFKQCLKEVAEASGMSLTFMAKPDAARAGSSCRNASSAMCMPRATCSGSRTRSRNRSRDSRRASLPSAPLVPTSSSTTRTSFAPRWLPSTRRSPTGNASATSSGYETQGQGG